ncbi:MAG: leucine-rich repeat protein [Firmicutes bacterium]|nr:leucine-rich repeat protein [Bacillota bacterium]
MNSEFNTNTLSTKENVVVREGVRKVSAPEVVREEIPVKLVEYAVEGGNIFFDVNHNNVEGCDKNITRADIPSEIEGKEVLSIGESAFKACRELKSVSIPKSVVNIGVWAFEDCDGLEEIKISEENQIYKDNEGVLFSKNGNTLIKYPAAKAGEYYVPEGTVNIASYAFYHCLAVTEVYVPATVANIQSHAFENGRCLRAIRIDEKNRDYKDINGVLFTKNGKTLLRHPAGHGRSFAVDENIENIADDAFTGSETLKFIYCVRGSLADNIMIYPLGVSIKYIASEDNAQAGVKSCVCPAEGGNIYIDISEGALLDCDKTVSFAKIPTEVKGTKIISIAPRAFERCEFLTHVDIPESIKSVGTGAFGECTGLESVKISQNIKFMDSEAFRGCTALRTVACKQDSVADDRSLYNENVIFSYSTK